MTEYTYLTEHPAKHDKQEVEELQSELRELDEQSGYVRHLTLSDDPAVLKRQIEQARANSGQSQRRTREIVIPRLKPKPQPRSAEKIAIPQRKTEMIRE